MAGGCVWKGIRQEIRCLLGTIFSGGSIHIWCLDSIYSVGSAFIFYLLIYLFIYFPFMIVKTNLCRQSSRCLIVSSSRPLGRFLEDVHAASVCVRCAEIQGGSAGHMAEIRLLTWSSLCATGCNRDALCSLPLGVLTPVFIFGVTAGDWFKSQVSQLTPSMTINHHNP